MPFYEYQCRSCDHYVEVMQKISDAPLKKCPSCGRMTLVKLVSAPVFRLKGGGWYETDFKSDKEAKHNLAGTDREESKPAEPAKTTPAASTTEGTASASAAKPAQAATASPGRRRAQPAARPSARAKPSAPKRRVQRRAKR